MADNTNNKTQDHGQTRESSPALRKLHGPGVTHLHYLIDR